MSLLHCRSYNLQMKEMHEIVNGWKNKAFVNWERRNLKDKLAEESGKKMGDKGNKEVP